MFWIIRVSPSLVHSCLHHNPDNREYAVCFTSLKHLFRKLLDLIAAVLVLVIVVVVVVVVVVIIVVVFVVLK